MTRQALVAYSVGLLGLILVKVLAPGVLCAPEHQDAGKDRGDHAGGDPADEPRVHLASAPCRARHAGLALAISLGACLNAGLLFYKLRQHGIFRPQPGWLGFLVQDCRGAVADGRGAVAGDGRGKFLGPRSQRGCASGGWRCWSCWVPASISAACGCSACGCAISQSGLCRRFPGSAQQECKGPTRHPSGNP